MVVNSVSYGLVWGNMLSCWVSVMLFVMVMSVIDGRKNEVFGVRCLNIVVFCLLFKLLMIGLRIVFMNRLVFV